MLSASPPQAGACSAIAPRPRHHKHTPITHGGAAQVGRTHTRAQSMGSIRQAAWTRAVYPLGTFQIRRGSTTARLGDRRAGCTSLGGMLAQPVSQKHISSSAVRRTGDGQARKPRKNTPLKINSSSRTLTIDQGKSETRKCFIGKVQKNQSLQLNLQQ